MRKAVKAYKKLTALLLSVLLLSALLPIPAIAVCAHTWSTYSDASHPHERYKYCSKCGAVQYLGTYATKRHGDGSWGSGTCPDCGSCSYSGRSCTSQGVCACGDTLPAYGHNYAAATCKDAKTCTQCEATSGSPLGHNYTLYCDPAHITDSGHAQFNLCSRCDDKSYTGGYTAKPHGPGSTGSNSCKQCGSHSYTLEVTTSSVHPHPQSGKCICGDTGSPGNAAQPYAGCSVCYPPVNVTGISLSESTLVLDCDDSIMLTATLSPSNATNQTLIWSTDNVSVASVSATGYVRGLNYGSATITATAANGVSASCTVYVCAYNSEINHFYDSSFVSRYGYTSNVATLNGFQNAINPIIAEKLLLNIYSNAPSAFSSLADNCVAGLDALCPGTAHSNTGYGLCTNKSGLYDHFCTWHAGSTTVTNVLWTGHKLDSNRSASYASTHTVMMVNIFADTYLDAVYQDCQPGVLLHELCHQYGGRDHYHEQLPDNSCKNGDICSLCGNNPRPNSCIMFNDWYNASELVGRLNTLFCESCRQEMMTHLELHH